MDILGAATQNLVSPLVLFFLLGILAGLLKSSLTIPATVGKSIGLYLMMAIGYRGGAELSHSGFTGSIATACIAAVALGAALPFAAYGALRWTTRLDSTTAAAVAAHYGSVSAVTFAAAIAVLHHRGERFEPYMVALMAVMEAPAILTGLLLARRGAPARGADRAADSLAKTVSREVLLHGSVFLLLGSFAIGWLTGSRGFADLDYVFVRPFNGILCVFLLDVGLLVAQRLSDLRAMNVAVAAFGLYMPLVGAAAGLGLALILGMSAGGATLFAVLGGSASYIVVPAVMREALPTASPAIYMTLALGITFPFNLILGIPLYHGAARALTPAVASKAASMNDGTVLAAGAVAMTKPSPNQAAAGPIKWPKPGERRRAGQPCQQNRLAPEECDAGAGSDPRSGPRPMKRAPLAGDQLYGRGLQKLMGTVKYPAQAPP